MSKGTVVAAMSGGVDSAVAAALLKRQGYDVIGITLQIWQEHSDQGKYGGCCSLGAVEDARRAAASIGIPHYVLNFRDYFASKVIDHFVQEYSRGRTPNPCIECNRSVKFEELLRQAENLGADYLATGHYARVRRNEETGRYELLRARDAQKDQSYALYTLSQHSLSHTLMPLGKLANKQETRNIAKTIGLALASKPDSQEICFVPREGYTSYLREHAPDSQHPGLVMDRSGNEIGEHEGISNYTIGQRKRLPASNKGALFVVELLPETNTVVVGSDEDLYSDGFEAVRCSWASLSEAPSLESPLAAYAKIRYNGQIAPVSFAAAKEAGVVQGIFETSQRAVTPGQAAVFYGGTGEEEAQIVLGGGTIEKAIFKNRCNRII